MNYRSVKIMPLIEARAKVKLPTTLPRQESAPSPDFIIYSQHDTKLLLKLRPELAHRNINISAFE